ncbi:hypothetical protein L596_029491 [Steinernema carpocapsae]|uniref:G-protein coupled receptors family 1 profile domain-containing protein n=1 Tax=Steinernema carpocapsae TaxID=34508 RepID=A0A4U5LUT7_STECR|nr:hypothetical protein L596_029491 [Steinernema carpocapsae]
MEVDEKGVTAAAATGAIAVPFSMQICREDCHAEINADGPFLYGVTHRSTPIFSHFLASAVSTLIIVPALALFDSHLNSKMSDVLFEIAVKTLKEQKGTVSFVSPLPKMMALAAVNEGAQRSTNEELTENAFKGIMAENTTNATIIYFLSGFKLIVISCFLPAYIVLIWVFASRSVFYTKVVYKIMMHIGIMNCFHMMTTGYACIMDFWPGGYNFYVVWIFFYIRYSHSWTITLLNLIMATNRVYVVLRVHASDNRIFKVAIYLVWSTLVCFPVLFSISQLDHGYKPDSHTYYYNESHVFSIVLTYFCLCVNCVTLAAYLFLVIGVMYKRFAYHKTVKFSSVEKRILIQALLTFFFFAGFSTAAHYFPEDANVYLTSAFTVFLSLIPCVVFLIHMGFNPFIRKHVACFIARKNYVANSTVMFRENSKTRVSVVYQLSGYVYH